MSNKTNGNSEKYTLIIGLGYFEKEMVDHLRQQRTIKVMEIKEAAIDKLKGQFDDVEFINGDSSSLVTWKKLDKQAISQIIITIRDKDIVHETCRIIREYLELEILIIVISYDDYDTGILDEFNITVVRPLQMSLDIIANLLDKNVSWPVNIGNREGEIVEVQVLKNSHLIGVKLKHIRPISWSVALIYKNGKPSVPNANTRITIGDRVIIVGEPNVVKGIIETLSKGEPNFPLQFGPNIAVLCHRQYPKLIDEAVYLLRNTLANKLHILPVKGKSISKLAEKLKNEKVELTTGEVVISYEDIADLKDGMIVMPKKKGLFYAQYYRKFFNNGRSPILFTNGTTKYDHVLISLNTETPAFALETGAEFAKLLGAKFTVLYVSAIEGERGKKDMEYLNYRKDLIADFEMSDGVTIDHEILSGNPVIETVERVAQFKGENCMVVVTFDPEDSTSVFKPNVPYLITRKTEASVLAIPVEDTHA
ncbi:TrkA-C domain protein [Denitrovibrio acetiphilus DSM 12809]|uniref:TrkA-C domain protein n=1 Tax=Denitrovibrio acetiphilus (strain DSM 12809 / NBRC 114555 / N2460) TaxID=522772 RepID=D4H141_DENA2|nr:TrkA C-terminal domain-containing protein [Denitrovibrio acetiphilus]ADD68704.1 TrkA-C domain protein [Denitrovibrio acetiphilus DSM 12809]